MSLSNARFKAIERQFVLVIVGLVIVSVGLLGFLLYEANNIRLGSDVTALKIQEVVKDHTDVADYLESQKSAEAHFVTIANLIKDDQQETLTQALIVLTIPIIIATGIIGYLVARYLLRPVKESYASQERFMQDAAHELRNPLAAMSAAVQNQLRKDGKTSAFTRTMARQTKRLVRINEDLLYLERRQPGQIIEKVDISELLEDVLEDLQAKVQHKNLILKTTITAGIKKEMIPSDFVKLSRNIIENAIKYTPSGKKIKISLEQSGKTISLIVKDQGIGIPTQDIEHIGERFYRAKNATTAEGSGLGIAIAHKVANTYGGRLTLKSTLNKGTTVTITL